MTQPERQALAEKLFECAMYYGKHDLKRENVSALIDVINNYLPYSSSQIVKGISDYMTDPKNRIFPAPAQLRPYITPELDTRDIAVTLARALISAIKSHQEGWISGYWSSRGPYWIYKHDTFPTWRQAALKEIGSLGVAVIQRYGWKNLCDAYFDSDETTFNAQIREYILATQRLAAIGHLDTKFKLVESQGAKDILALSSNTVKAISVEEPK